MIRILAQASAKGGLGTIKAAMVIDHRSIKLRDRYGEGASPGTGFRHAQYVIEITPATTQSNVPATAR